MKCQLKIGVIYVVLICIGTARICAQPSAFFRNLDVSDGLPSNYITAINEDEQGYKWIGTEDGLTRFDGLNFEQFYHDPSDSSSIGFNHVGWDIAEDNHGRIWVSLYGQGFSRYDSETDGFKSFTFANGALPAKWADHVQNFMFSKNGIVYINCVDGILKVNANDSVEVLSYVRHNQLLNGLGDLRVATLVDGRWIWCATTNGLARFDIEKATWEYSNLNPQGKLGFSGSWLIHSGSFANGKLWFATFMKPKGAKVRYLYSYNLVDDVLDSIPIAPSLERKQPFSDLVSSVLVLTDGSLKLASEDLGLLSYNPSLKKWEQQLNNGHLKGNLPQGPIKTLFEDRDKNLWVSTESGLSILNASNFFINYPTAKTSSGNQLSLTGIKYALVDSDNGIWVGKETESLYYLNQAKRVVRQVKAKDAGSGEKQNYQEPQALVDGKLIYHVWFDGLRIHDLRTNLTSRIPLNEDVNLPELRKVFPTKNGPVYASGQQRFGVLDIEEGTFDKIQLDEILSNDFVIDLAERQDGLLWLSLAKNGLMCLNPNNNSIVDHWTRDTLKYPSTTIWNLEIVEGQLFFTVQGEGLWQLDIYSKSITKYSKYQGLCSNNVEGLILDGKNDLWIYSSSGISWFDRENKKFRTFTESDGMISQNIRDADLLSNGQILLVTDKGLIEFDPERLKQSAQSSMPVIRSLHVFDQKVILPKGSENLGQITVPYDKNYLRAQFSAMEFFDPERVRFAYRLEGVEQHWNYTGQQPVAIYSNLYGGNYNLCVKRTNIFGEWGPELCVPIHVTTPIYRQAWFILLMSIFSLIITYWIYRWQLKKRLAVVALRNRVSQDLHDDIGSTLSSINIFSTVAQEQLGNTDTETKVLLKQISEGAEKMMQNMDDIVWAINPNNDQLSTLQSRMLEYAVPILEAKGIEIETDIRLPKGSVSLSMEKRKNLFLIFKETINNMAKHAQASRAWISMRMHGNNLALAIKDNGAGFDSTTPTNRNGLRNIRDRSDEIGGQLEIRSEPGIGTELSITVAVP